MILRRVRLFPFGCFADAEVELEPGLNVVLGPNEAGKSTLFSAIRQVLFVPSQLHKKGITERVAPYLPASGGDSISVELSLQAAGTGWVLHRRWGTSPSCRLSLPGGGSLSDETAVTAELLKLLPAGPATTSNILMTEQATLAGTLQLLQEDKRGKDSLADLDDILRRAVLETGGVSVDRFRARVELLRTEAWSRWDRAAAGAEEGRGLDRPWKKEVGTLLAAWYAREEARAALRAAETYDTALDAVNEGLRTAAAAGDQARAFVQAHREAAAAARARREVEAELRAVQAEARDMVKASVEWPVTAHRAAELSEASKKAAPALKALEKEAAVADAAEKARGLREKAARVSRRRAERDEAAERVKAAPRLERKDLDALRAAAAAADRASARVDAGKMSVTVAGRAPVEISVQEDFAPEEKRSLGPGATLRLSAAGRLRIVHREMEIEVRSGDVDAAAAVEAAAAVRAAFSSLLQKHGCAGMEEAEERSRTVEALAADLRAAEKNLVDELGGESPAAFEERVAALGQAVETRPLAAVREELAALRARMEAGTRELAEINTRVADWVKRYVSPEALLTTLGSKKGREAELTQKIQEAAPVPPGHASAEAFLEAYGRAEQAAQKTGEDLRVLEERKRGLEETAPKQSAEELRVQADDAAEAFATVKRRAEALDRVAAKTGELLAASTASIHARMAGRLAHVLSSMTGGRHATPVMDGALPVALPAGTGRALPWASLSAGTRDTLALALRLAMADASLGDADGFMLLDDPLVEMDPGRQEAAAAALREFASRRQLVVFTCHPATADLLGGHRVSLPVPTPPAAATTT